MLGEIQRRLARKAARSVALGGSLRSTIEWATRDFENFLGAGDASVLEVLLGPDRVLYFRAAQGASWTRTDILVDRATGKGMECFRVRNGLFLLDRKDVKGWTRPRSLSVTIGRRSVRRHLAKQPTHASVFSEPRNAPALEAAVLDLGKGLLLRDRQVHTEGRADQIHMFGRFDSVVGRLQGSGRSTEFLRVECTREGRDGEVAKGYQVTMHGYPVSLEEVRRDMGRRTDDVLAAVIPMAEVGLRLSRRGRSLSSKR